MSYAPCWSLAGKVAAFWKMLHYLPNTILCLKFSLSKNNRVSLLAQNVKMNSQSQMVSLHYSSGGSCYVGLSNILNQCCWICFLPLFRLVPLFLASCWSVQNKWIPVPWNTRDFFPFYKLMIKACQFSTLYVMNKCRFCSTNEPTFIRAALYHKIMQIMPVVHLLFSAISDKVKHVCISISMYCIHLWDISCHYILLEEL